VDQNLITLYKHYRGVEPASENAEYCAKIMREKREAMDSIYAAKANAGMKSGQGKSKISVRMAAMRDKRLP
jgi:hypothetical protein